MSCLFLVNILHAQTESKPNEVLPKPDSAYYFVSRNTVIDTAQYSLYLSIRPIDKKDSGDTIQKISSNGEGWLNKDSIPIGEWKFYSKNINGVEYVLKEGVYKKTTPDLFYIMANKEDIRKLINLSESEIQAKQAAFTPYIKCGDWVYYHPNGKVWKKVTFMCKEIPIEWIVVMGEYNSYKLMVTVNFYFPDDENIWGQVLEYDEDGQIFKKLEFGSQDKIIYKAVYNKKGNVIKEARSSSWSGDTNIYPNNSW